MDPEISRDRVTMSGGEGRPGTLGQIVWESGYNRDVEGKADPEISRDGVTTGLRV